MTEDHKPKTAVYLLIEKNNKFLLSKRKNTGYKDGMYSLVAGHVDKGESFEQAMVREAKEEAGIEIEKKELQTSKIIHRSTEYGAYIDLFFKIDSWKGKIENEEPEKCSDLSWFEAQKLPDNTIDFVEKAVLNVDKDLELEELGW